MIKLGDSAPVVKTYYDDDRVQRVCRSEIVYIHPKGRYYTALYHCCHDSFKESFKTVAACKDGKTTGDRIKALRFQMGMNQHEFAKQLGTVQPHISQVEAGVRKPWPELLKGVSRLCGVSVEWIKNGGKQC